jgi:phosphoglucosamine mutase
MGKYFGTDGFRGEANENLKAEQAFAIGRFLGIYYGQKKSGDKVRAVIGKDTRRSCYMLEYALVSGLVSSGADAYLLHVTTTPSVAYTVRAEGFDCGIMISASHNPYYDNGIKLINADGEKTEDEVTALVERYLDGEIPVIPYAKRENIGRTVDYVEGRNRYIGYLISLGKFSFRDVRVGLDCANGSTWTIAKAVFEALGASVTVINDKPNGLNINLNGGSTHIEALRQTVIEKKLDIGFAYDGDGDRCFCVDEKGNVLTGDHILYICADYMKETGELSGNTVAATVMSNYGLFSSLSELGIFCIKTAVGDKCVCDAMRENACRLGGEQSGHIIFSKYASTGDGILTSLKIMEVMLARKKKASELAENFRFYPQILHNFRVTDKSAVMDDPRVRDVWERANRALSDHGRILLRPSGTESVIRLMAEAETEDICRVWAQTVIDTVNEVIEENFRKLPKKP